MIDIIIALPEAPQVYQPKPETAPAPRLDDTDMRIIQTVREEGPYKTWSILNLMANDSGLDRSESRNLRTALWGRVRRLKRLGLLFGRGRNEIAATKLVRLPTRRRFRRHNPTVVDVERVGAVSAGNQLDQALLLKIEYQSGAKVVVGDTDLPTKHNTSKETQSVITPENASDAGRALASLPRKKTRWWTGWLHGVHCWRGRLVVLPNGETAPLIWCCRGRMLLQNVNDLPLRDWMLWTARRADEVAVLKNPAACLLGSLKAGRTERKSEVKAESARRNGQMPCRVGRRRGRPRKEINPTTPETSQRAPSTGPLPCKPPAIRARP